jgi:hypothetical protein
MTRSALLMLATAVLASPVLAGPPPAADVHAIDFRNFTYADTACADEGASITVKDGVYDRDDEDDVAHFEVRDVVYGDLTNDGADEAVVLTLCNTGGTGQFTDGIVFTARAGKPVVLGTLGVGDRADGGVYRAEIRNGTLFVDRFGQDGSSGACCPQYVETSAVRWNGKKLVDAGASTKRAYVDYQLDDSPAPHALRFLRGTSSATLVGLTTEHGSYRLGARANQTLGIRFESEDETAEVVVASKSGQKIGSVTGRAAASIKLPATGDYVITVTSSKGSNDTDTYYKIDLSVL